MIRPIGKRVLLKRLQEENIQKGIILPDAAKSKQNRFEVIDIGEIDGCPVISDDIVLLNSYAGQEITIDDEIYIIAKYEDIMAVIYDKI
jgi:chaperonin GroES